MTEELYRHAHSLRGMSAAMGFAEIVSLAQPVEDLLGKLRGKATPLEGSAARRLGEAIARLQEMIAARGHGAIAAGDPELLAALTDALP